MSSRSPAVGRAAIIHRLRAAGCVFAEDEADLLLGDPRPAPELDALIARRVAGEPLEYVLGWAEFCGLRILVEPGVFVPRRRTEFLVQQAVSLLSPGAVLVDLCCGAGAIGVAIAAAVPGAKLLACDVESAAVGCARRNVEPIGGQVFEGDLYDALPANLRGRVDILAVNAPYVPTEAIDFMPAESRLYEPLVTLDGGSDGLDVQRRVIAAAPEWLAPGGYLLIETSERQAVATAAAFSGAGLVARIACDPQLDATVVIGSR